MMSNKHSHLTVTLDHGLNVSRRVTLVERLQRIYGVIEARFDSSNNRSLAVIFRNGTLGPATLLDYLSRQNASASLATCEPKSAYDDATGLHSDARVVESN